MKDEDLEVIGWRLFEESNDALFIVDPENNTILDANPAAQRLTQSPFRQLKGRNILDIIQADNPSKIKELLHAIRYTSVFHGQEYFRLTKEDGEFLEVNVSANRVHASSGVMGIVVVRDVNLRKQESDLQKIFQKELARQVDSQTSKLQESNRLLQLEIDRRKLAEKQLLESHEKLKQNVGDLEIARKLERRQERLNSLEQIAGGIAHDINNSLTTVLSFCEVLIEESESPQPLLDAIQVAAKDMAATTERLREYYRRDRDEFDIESRTVVDVKQLLQQVRQLTQPRWEQDKEPTRKIDVRIEVPEEMQIRVDESAMRTVLSNLVFNSVDAINGDGEIVLRGSRTYEFAELVVEDNGVGMSRDQLERCREAFFTTKQDGTGLGLSLCESIVRSQGGKFHIRSSPENGCSVHMSFPTPHLSSAKNSPAKPDTSECETDWIRNLRILIVDDDELFRTTLELLLVGMGASVYSCDTEHEALCLMDDGNFDVVICDMSLDGVNGMFLTAQIKSSRPKLPVLLMSGWLPDGEETHRGYFYQPDLKLAKPIRRHQLVAALEQLCRE